MLKNRLFASVFMIFMLLLTAASCGKKNAVNNLNSNQVTDQYYEGAYYQCDYQYDQELEARIEGLRTNSLKVVETFRRVYPYNFFFLNNIYPNRSNLTAMYPLQNSIAIQRSFLHSIVTDLQSYKGGLFYTWLVDGQAIDEAGLQSSVTSWDESFLSQIEARIRGLWEIKRRWKSDMCQKEQLAANRNFDIRAFSVLQQGRCGTGILRYEREGKVETGCLQEILQRFEEYRLMSPGLASFVERELLNACLGVQAKVFELVGNCAQALAQHQGQNKLMELWQHLERVYRQNYWQHYYSLRLSNRDFTCSDVEGTKTLTVKVDLSNLADNHRQHIKRDLDFFVKRRWSQRGKYAITFDYVQASSSRQGNVLKVVIRPGIVSHVASNDPWTIHLASEIFDIETNRRVVLAHELGHVFGFPDCYVNIYERNQDQTSYYTLDETNLMCNTSHVASIPESYFEELFNKRCR